MIKILIDSASDIDLKEAEEKGIYLMPIEVTFKEVTYLDGINLSHNEFFLKLVESNELPKTSQINPYRFYEEFEKLTSDGSDVICITISSKLSSTYNNAVTASKKFKNKVFVVDSLNASIGQRILCDLAIRLVEEGKFTAKEIATELDKRKLSIELLAVVGTLKYLKKGGRISSVVAFTGEMLSIKPVISIINGAVKMVGKARGSKRGNNLLIEKMNSCGGIDFSYPYATGYSGFTDDFLKKYLEDSKELWIDHTTNIPIYQIGSTIGTHVGPGAIAVAFFSKEQRK
ncbi:MAG: DegV family protein [Roseburia sp.]|nr:DegV family protein [Anaeroplasma bactoclasticum]MCM1196965.1 DegV family protein [Roseburia sp.]MCM1557645.1 DegV family protein [Anaeroplasma bactoclasticum]